jgi:ATP-dependent DNA helicase RecQ
MEDLQATLEQYWGYRSFRPKQEEIVRALLAGRDVAAVMPTGGGKSLCYQLPAVHGGKLCVVVSPLIALMEDQAAHLEKQGIPAAALHSNVEWPAQRQAWDRAAGGELRLLYLSPERLARDDTFDRLARLPIAWFAIDEAHCISEWGHEFRPEYRKLGGIRERFPDCAIAAFTASATRRVRHDILTQLKLREPAKFILSFHRANLRYVAAETKAEAQFRALLAALEELRGQSVIVYCGTIKSVEETAQELRRRGVAATTYHGKLESGDRQRNQEQWMRDEAPVMVSTLAFGLGINKPSTRAVIHLAMPKSVEQYYQEAGRAGRDGEEALCLLLWQRRDLALLAHFIDQLEDEEEKRRAWQRYREVKAYAESAFCRARVICRHFGEDPKWESCGKCDVCMARPDWLDEALVSGPAKRQRRSAAFQDAGLAGALRQWRKELATRRGVPAFRIFSDAVLGAIAAAQPASLAELAAVNGMGPKKIADFGDELIAAIRARDIL